MIDIMLIGLGQHATHRHFKALQILEDHSLARCTVVVDIASAKDRVGSSTAGAVVAGTSTSTGAGSAAGASCSMTWVTGLFWKEMLWSVMVFISVTFGTGW